MTAEGTTQHRSSARLGRAPGVLSAAFLLTAFWAVTAEAAVVSYQKGDGKGSVSETDDTVIDATVPDTTWVDDGQDITHFEVDTSAHRHTLLKFPNIFGPGLNQIPPGATILSAILTLNMDNEGTDCPNAHQLTEGWTEAEATWNSRRTAVSWTDAGADGATSRKAAVEAVVPCALPVGDKTLDVITSVQNWSNGEANEGWVFVDTGASSNGVNFRSSEHATAADRPELTVSFVRPVSYSVGTNAGDLKNGGPTLTIAGGVATLTVAQPDHVGVGDEVTYSGGTRAFISGRVSSTVYTLTDRLGVPPPDIGPGIVVDSIKRAFNTLKDAALSSDTASYLGTADLVAGSFQLNWPCYADGPDPSSYVRIEEPWITGPGNYIRAYTPTDPTEVGVSQRHQGVAGTGYRIAPTGAATNAFYNFILVSTDFGYVRIEGLEIDGSSLTDGENLRGLMANDSTTSQDVRFTHNLVHDITNTTIDDTDQSRVIGIFLDNTDNSKVANNIVYNLTSVSANAQGQARGIEGDDAGKTHHVYNNTFYNIRATATAGLGTGILDIGGSTIFARNNYVGLVDNTVGGEECFSGTFAAENNNVSSDLTAGGASSQTGQSNYAAYFLSVVSGLEDLHLLSDSIALWGSDGADLDSDPVLPVTDDIDGEARDATAPDIGADEYASPMVFYSVGISTADLGTGSPTITISSGLATLSAPQTNDVGVGDEIDYDSPSKLVYISAVVSPTQFRVLAATGALPVDVPGPGVGVNSIKRAFNSIASAATNSRLAGYLGTGDLVTADRRLTWVCYDDGPLSVAATTDITGYTTDAAHFITLTVAGASQVATGSSQRHFGIAGTGTRMEVTSGTVSDALDVDVPFTRIEWLEIDGNDNTTVGGILLQSTSVLAIALRAMAP